MDWFVAYLVSIIIVGTIWGMAKADKYHSDKDSPMFFKDSASVFFALCAVLVWPLSLTIATIKMTISIRRSAVVQKAQSIMSQYHFERITSHDRTLLLEVPEACLKHLFYAYRYKYIELKAWQADMIREELINRLTERTLLR